MSNKRVFIDMLGISDFAHSRRLLAAALAAAALGLFLLALSAAPATAYQPDPLFGTGGFTLAENHKDSQYSDTRSMAQRPGGGWVIVGSTMDDPNWEGSERWTIAAFTADGKPDLSFGVNGRLKTYFPKRYDYRDSFAAAVAVQPDGKIIVAGQIDVATARDQAAYEKEVGTDLDCSCSAMRPAWAVARFTTAGKLDRGFGYRGVKTIRGVTKSWSENSFDSSIDDIVVQPNGGIVILGSSQESASGRGASSGVNSMLLYRLRSNGSIDTRFGPRGRIHQPLWSGVKTDFFPQRLALTPNGSFTVAGFAVRQSKKLRSEIVYAAATRITERGRFDRSYGSSSYRLRKTGKWGFVPGAIEFFPDGSIAFAGSRIGRTEDDDPVVEAMTILKFEANGDLAREFGSAGSVDLRAALGDGYAEFKDTIAISPDDSIVAFLRNRDKYEGALLEHATISAAGAITYGGVVSTGSLSAESLIVDFGFVTPAGVVIGGDYSSGGRQELLLGRLVP